MGQSVNNPLPTTAHYAPIMDEEFHIVVSLWKGIELMLIKIYPAPVTEQEKIFGILGDSPAITLRNWLTYVLRFCIHQQERKTIFNRVNVSGI